MTDQELERLRRKLLGRSPFTRRSRLRTIRSLQPTLFLAQTVSLLVDVVSSADEATSSTAQGLLRQLSSQHAISRFCDLWEKGRDDRLATILVSCRYVGGSSDRVVTRSALKCGARERLPFDLRELLDARGDPDPVIASAADAVLRSLGTPRSKDYLCQLALADPTGDAAKICVECAYIPQDQVAACRFMLETGQADLYAHRDPKYAALRRGYPTWHPAIQQKVSDVIASDPRLIDALRRPLWECNDGELRRVADTWIRERQWEQIFFASLQLPMRLGIRLVAELSSK